MCVRGLLQRQTGSQGSCPLSQFSDTAVVSGDRKTQGPLTPRGISSNKTLSSWLPVRAPWEYTEKWKELLQSLPCGSQVYCLFGSYFCKVLIPVQVTLTGTLPLSLPPPPSTMLWCGELWFTLSVPLSNVSRFLQVSVGPKLNFRILPQSPTQLLSKCFDSI